MTSPNSETKMISRELAEVIKGIQHEMKLKNKIDISFIQASRLLASNARGINNFQIKKKGKKTFDIREVKFGFFLPQNERKKR